MNLRPSQGIGSSAIVALGITLALSSPFAYYRWVLGVLGVLHRVLGVLHRVLGVFQPRCPPLLGP